MSLAEVARVVDGRLGGAAVPDAAVTSVVLDSRQAAPGALFAAFVGERVDGHEFAAAADDAGAVATLASRPVDAPHLLVPDVTAALAALAAEALRRLPQARVVALTGSSGKTSTKDLIAGLLEQLGPTVAPPGSYNNDLGLPLTVLRADADTRFLVLEMGARGRGHIARLCRIAPPSIAVALNVGSAHLGEFGSREAIAASKGEIIEAAREVAVLNADDPLVLGMAERAQPDVRIVTFGERAAADVRAEQISLDELGHPRFELVTGEWRAPVQLPSFGEHQVSNALAAAAVALQAGLPAPDVAACLGTLQPRSRWRMEVRQRGDGLVVVNDAYNANPESMRAALKALAAMARSRGRRAVAVLGPMYELGEASTAEHDAVGRLAVRLDVGKLVVVGREAAAIHTGASLEGSWGEESVLVDDVEAAVELLRAEVRPDDVVLVKASRAAGLERVAEALLGGSGDEPA